MPHGFFTVEEWRTDRQEWLAIGHLNADGSISRALEKLQRRGQPGSFRIVQMQRCVWAEIEGGKLRLHGSHASSPENLAEIVKIFEGEGGRRPVKKARLQHLQAKAKGRAK